ncbi:GDP-mannose 4,6-dehydratase [Halomontanus rarus]|uniref:GDP-mannose 4,6-dehydratase n=1 Tax=Halomontanus rarus TaxID=3034020 RepID=UPI0023E75C12|nr:GDP-mannose 4,6-dehydratase [Halovivax sp. TS33]
MKVLVTGGAGFIGGHLAQQFVRDGYNVTTLDNLDPFYDTEIKNHTIEQCRRSASTGHGTYEFIEGNVTDEDLITDLVADADLVYHQAAKAGVRPSVKNPREYDEVNVDGTLNILDAARDTDCTRVIFASSSSVYGKPQYLPYDEEHPTTPISPYGASKLAAERYACVYNEVYDLPIVGLRYFTVYGPRMRPNMAISNFVSRCHASEPPIIYGDGTQTRDFTYIEDIVAANQTLLQSDSADGKVLNIGSTDNISITGLAEVIRDQINTDLELVYDDARQADAEHTHASVEKAADLIGYSPSYTIKEGVMEFVDWYRENRDWYEPLVRSS